MDAKIAPDPAADLVTISEVPSLMTQIRPQWQAKGLIERVRRLLPIDPSSACQRLLNAAVQDLREKVVIAGIDIAGEAAAAHKLPPINKPEDVEGYSTATLLDLCYRMGLLARPQWRRLARAYDIRRDLEHEDSQYEASVEDCIYIFKSCIEAVLSRDPITLVKVSEVKQIIEASGPIVADARLSEDYENAPDTRQEEIQKFLMSKALDVSEPDLVMQNAYVLLHTLSPVTRDSVRVSLAKYLQDKFGRDPLSELQVRVARAAGVLPYLRKTQRATFFGDQLRKLQSVGYDWRANPSHGPALRCLAEFGGVSEFPEEIRAELVKWLAFCYIGEPGGYGAGLNRKVFYSNSGAPLVIQLLGEARDVSRDILRSLQSNVDIIRASKNEYVARRFQDLLDLVEA